MTHYTYGAPTAETVIFMAGSRVHLALYRTLCGRGMEAAKFAPDQVPEATEGVCRRCLARLAKDIRAAEATDPDPTRPVDALDTDARVAHDDADPFYDLPW